ncbi:hypothetical protein ACGGKE_00975 [Sphingobium naphthae]|uniref:hypothetical protein n=1 Tax=Sphingobium naphthae TaxID=1886786 RepID=UPI00374A7E30
MSDLQSLDVTRAKRSRSKRTSAAKISHEGAASKDWTIKGLPSETVNISREAAKRSGMKINAWVSKALETAASDDAMPSFANAMQTHNPQFDAHIIEEIAKLRMQNEDLAQTINSMSALLLKMYVKSS